MRETFCCLQHQEEKNYKNTKAQKKQLNIQKRGGIGVDEMFPSKVNYDPKLVLLMMFFVL